MSKILRGGQWHWCLPLQIWGWVASFPSQLWSTPKKVCCQNCCRNNALELNGVIWIVMSIIGTFLNSHAYKYCLYHVCSFFLCCSLTVVIQDHRCCFEFYTHLLRSLRCCVWFVFGIAITNCVQCAKYISTPLYFRSLNHHSTMVVLLQSRFDQAYYEVFKMRSPDVAKKASCYMQKLTLKHDTSQLAWKMLGCPSC